MKNYQFEEITFWLSLIACLLAYDAEILWLAKILEGISVINFFCAIVNRKNKSLRIFANRCMRITKLIWLSTVSR